MATGRSKSGDRRLLHELESSILNPETLEDLEKVKTLFHPDYLELGSSGLVYNRLDVLGMLEVSDNESGVMIRDFEVHKIINNAVLATYRSIGVSGKEARRSSVWVKSGGSWQIRFHQGTRVPSTWDEPR